MDKKRKPKKTIIRIRRGLAGDWGIRKHGSRKLLRVFGLYKAIRKVSGLIEDRESVVAINVEIIRK